MSKSESSNIKLSQSHLSEKVNALPPSGIRKFFDLLSSMEGVISLGVGEPDFVTPWYIREAAIYSLEKGYTMYTSNKGTPELRAALAKDLQSRYGLTYNPEDEILITVGVSEGLDLAARAILNPGDEVIMPDPCYVAYPAAISLAGGIPVLVPTIVENDFEITAEDIEARITQKTKAILIGYACRPTGAAVDRGATEIALDRGCRANGNFAPFPGRQMGTERDLIARLINESVARRRRASSNSPWIVDI